MRAHPVVAGFFRRLGARQRPGPRPFRKGNRVTTKTNLPSIEKEVRTILRVQVNTMPTHVLAGLAKGSPVQMEASRAALVEKQAIALLRRFEVMMQTAGGDWITSRDAD